MKLTKLSINNYQFTIIIFVLMTIAGMNSFLTMPRTENPEMSAPGASVFIAYPGASPADLEQLIASPIEDAVNELEDIKKIETSIKDGLVSVSVEFFWGVDTDKKHDEVIQQVNSIKPNLPSDIYYLEVFKWSVSDVAMMQLALVSDDASYKELKEEADKLIKDLKKGSGVKKIKINACPEEEVRISLDFEKMAALNIGLDQVENAIKSNNANIPGGSIEIGDKSFSINTSGSYQSLEELKNTVIHSYNGRLIYLKNIAEVNFLYEDNRYFAGYNGHNAIFISLQPKEGRNVFETTEEIEKYIIAFDENLPEDIQLEYVFSQADEVGDRIQGFLSNLYQGMFLVGVVVLLALGIRSSLVVIIAIPLSIVIGLSLVDMAGFGMQQISIAGLVVALGLLVDNSIVIIENINRFIKNGYKPKEAALAAVKEIGWPVVSATLTTLLAFIPIITMPDKTGEFIRSLPLTITATLSVSLLIALTLTPLITSKLFKPIKEKKVKKEKKSHFKGLLKSFIEGPYRKTLNFTLKRKGFTIAVSILLLLSSVFVFQYVGLSFFPKAEKPQFMIQLYTPDGSNLETTHEVVKEIEAVLDTIKQIDFYASNTGHGNPRLYYNTFERNYTKNFGEIFVKLKHFDVVEYTSLVEKLRAYFETYYKANVYIKEFEQGPPITAPVMIYVSGENINVLKDISYDVENLLKKQNGAINVENLLVKNRVDLHFKINKDKAGMFGVPIHEIDKTIRTAINGLTISNYRDSNGDDYNIIMRLPTESDIKMSDLDKIYVKSLIGKMIPLKQLVSVEFEEAPGLITRYNLERTAIVTADLAKDYTLDDVINPIIEELELYNFPTGYTYKIRGELEGRQESFGGMKRAILISIISIFAILVLQFKSFAQPLIIFSAILLALIGAIWTLFITGYAFSFTAFIGLSSLVGIVINNSIILVDYANQLIKKGETVLNAVKLSGETRFTPIVLTTLTTVGGLLPLTLKGGTLWAPMGWTIIGGLLVSTFLTLLVVPVLYSLLTRDK